MNKLDLELFRATAVLRDIYEAQKITRGESTARMAFRIAQKLAKLPGHTDSLVPSIEDTRFWHRVAE